MNTNTLPKTQKQRLLATLQAANGQWLTLFQIQELCHRQFGASDSETALSARWRELPHSIKECRKRPGTRSTFEYRLIPGVAA